MKPRRVVRLLSPVARALQRAHNFPGKDGPVAIVHRDLKPDNIVIATVNDEEVVKILDFGIAKVKSVATQVAGRQSQDGAGAVPFTPGYAAPEQWFPKRYGQSGPWTDVWGLALCAVEAMSGKAAIDGDHAAMMGTAVDERRRPTPGSEGVRVADEVETVFTRALAVDPRHRYHEVGDFWDALEDACGLPSSRALAGLGNAARDPRSEGPPPPTEERIEAAEQRQRRSLRPPGAQRMSIEGKNAVTPQGGSVDAAARGAIPNAGVPALDVPELDAGGRNKEPEPPSSGRDVPVSGASGQAPAKKLVQGGEAASTTADQPPKPKDKSKGPEVPVEHGFGPLTPLSGKGNVPAEPSGIDLAVSPQDMRRTSSASMQAVRPPKPGAAGSSRGTSDDAAVKPAASARSGAHAPVSARAKLPAIETKAPSKRLGVPIALALTGILIAFAYYINASMGGGRWALGPVPVNWIAGLLAVVGTALVLIRLFWPED